jgi:glycosyltransferase involved in cell wall biosynthesis
VIKRQGELWLGTLAGLRPVKNLPRLVRAFAGLPEPWQLVIVGDGPEREVIREETLRLDIAHRVHLPGHIGDPAKVVGLFDLFACHRTASSSRSAWWKPWRRALPWSARMSGTWCPCFRTPIGPLSPRRG